MHKKNNQNGNITIEATIVLSTVIFFFCFLLNFGYIFRAQHFMSQIVQDTGKNLAFSAYRYSLSSENSLTYAARTVAQVFGYDSYNNDIRIAWNSKQYSLATQKNLELTMEGKGKKKSDQLKSYYIKDYSVTKANVENNDLDIIVTYTVELPFPVFGLNDIVLHQQTLNRIWTKVG